MVRVEGFRVWGLGFGGLWSKFSSRSVKKSNVGA